MDNVHICSFSSGLDDMKRKDQRDVVKVLAVLKERKRYSCFEATANPVIARTMTFINWRNLVKNTGGQFPWTNVEITALGESVLAGELLPPVEDPTKDMMRVGNRTYVHKNIAEALGFKEYVDK